MWKSQCIIDQSQFNHQITMHYRSINIQVLATQSFCNMIFKVKSLTSVSSGSSSPAEFCGPRHWTHSPFRWRRRRRTASTARTEQFRRKHSRNSHKWAHQQERETDNKTDNSFICPKSPKKSDIRHSLNFFQFCSHMSTVLFMCIPEI